MSATLIKSSGETVDVTPATGKFSLKTLQGLVGGYIEVVRLPEEQILICNEEGLLNNLPYNLSASLLTGRILVGDVVIAPDSSLD